MIMDNFLMNVQKHMINFKKKNLNILNQLKIQMFQARKQIQKNLIKIQFGITQSNLIQDSGNNQSKVHQNYESNMKSNIDNKLSKNASTNYNSRTLGSRITEIQSQNSILQNGLQNFNKNNKQNEDPNINMKKRMKTDISIIEQFPVKYKTDQSDQNLFKDLQELRNDESILINTEDVRKKYQKFISPTSHWSSNQGGQNGGQNHPFCTQFFHQVQNYEKSQKQTSKHDKQTELFEFDQINQTQLQKNNTIKQLEEYEENGEQEIF